MLVKFKHNEKVIPKLVVQNVEIEQVQQAKLLGLIINNNLDWKDNIQYIYSKACKRIYYLVMLKRSRSIK